MLIIYGVIAAVAFIAMFWMLEWNMHALIMIVLGSIFWPIVVILTIGAVIAWLVFTKPWKKKG